MRVRTGGAPAGLPKLLARSPTSNGKGLAVPTLELPLIPFPRHWSPDGETIAAERVAGLPIHTEPAEEGGPEEYTLEITPRFVILRAAGESGLRHGRTTWDRLLAAAASGCDIPCGRIQDGPAFVWRGMLLDCCRHYMEPDFILRILDLLALHKFNVLHWHLTEDQGWRLEVPGLPGLTEVAAWRQGQEGTRYGGFYTAEEVRRVVEHADGLGITVVPEIELPGHCTAALAAYPQLSCTGGPFEVETGWGVFPEIYCAGNDQVFRFLEQVLEHVLDLFPSRFIHIGGDEAPKDRWRECPRCQKRILTEGLADENELQSWFVRHFDRWLSERGRRLIGWDEILEGGLAPGATVHSWRGYEGALAAIRAGHDTVVSPTSHAYFDYPADQLPLQQVYTFDPIPNEASDDERDHVLGGQLNLWTERCPQERVDFMLFPRLCAMAECLWTGADRPGFSHFARRLGRHLDLLCADAGFQVQAGPAGNS